MRLAIYDKYLKTTNVKNDIKSSGKDSGLAEYAKLNKDNHVGLEII